jgi:quercetin dioxygenase-like cupin family protein
LAEISRVLAAIARSSDPGGHAIEITPDNEKDVSAGPAEWFTGAVTLRRIGAQPAPGRVQALLVTFEPGARTAWHKHPFGQILHILSGRARVRSASGELVEVEAGSSVRFEPDEDHWHGAAPDGPMTHVAIQEVNADGVGTFWDRHVTEDEYHGR